MVMFNWNNVSALAAALHAAYPEEDRGALTAARIEILVRSLPDFDGAVSPPSAQHIDHLRWTWMRIADASLPQDIAA